MAEKPVTDEVTDEELSKAFDEFNSETKEETVEEKTEDTKSTAPVEETGTDVETKELSEEEKAAEEHRQRSREGRKLKGLKGREEWERAKDSEIEELKSQIKAITGGTQKVGQAPPEDEAELDRIREIDDPIEQKRAIDAYDRTKQMLVRANYEKAYMSQIGVIASTVEDVGLHDEVIDLMVNDNRYNLIHTGRPDADARINYAEAKAAIVLKMASEGKKPAYPGRGDGSTAPVQPAGTSTTMATRAPALPSFSKEEQDYVDYLRNKCGYSDADIAKAVA